MEDKVKYWMDIAEYDLETAEPMLTTKRYLYVGFMCHQALEKMLKAYFVHVKRQTPPYMHKLTLLAEQSSIFPLLSEEQKHFLEIMQPLNIEARYPTYKEKILQSLTHERCIEILNETKEFTQWIKARLSK